MKKALFPLTADPPTRAHVNLIARSLRIFDEVHVVLFQNPEKHQFILHPEERVALLREIFPSNASLVLSHSSQLVVDYAYEQGITTLVRGFRDVKDLIYERYLEEGNKNLFENLETVYIRSAKVFAEVSSSMVKELITYQGDISGYVTPNVKEYLERREGKYLVGVTGSTAVGKTTLLGRLVKALREAGEEAHYIDLDKTIHRIYAFGEKEHLLLKERLLSRIDFSFFDEEGALDRRKLSNKIFNGGDEELLAFLTTSLKPFLKMEIKKELKDKKGFIFIDGVHIVEGGYLKMTNDNLLLVDCPPLRQREQLQGRTPMPQAEMEKRIQLAGSSQDKKESYLRCREGWGTLWTLNNDERVEENLRLIQRELTEYFKRKTDPLPTPSRPPCGRASDAQSTTSPKSPSLKERNEEGRIPP